MQAAVYFALLAFYQALLCAQTATRSISDRHTESCHGKGLQSVCSSGADHRSDVLFLKASAAFKRAASLRDKQTAKDLTAATVLFRTSAELFAAIGSLEQAADAHLQTGDIYFTLSQYDKARGSYREALKEQSPEMRCRAMSRIARTYAATGPFLLVNRYSKEALESCRGLSVLAQAEALEARGEALDFAGDREQSEVFFRRARELFAQAGDKNGENRTQLLLAYTDLFS